MVTGQGHLPLDSLEELTEGGRRAQQNCQHRRGSEDGTNILDSLYNFNDKIATMPEYTRHQVT